MSWVEVADKRNETDSDGKKTIRLNIPQRIYLVPSAAIIVGSAIGLVRGAQRASLQFLAENVHRPPTTVQGWYFYNKTKNYKVMLGGLKGAGGEASKLGLIALGYVGMEEGLDRVGWGEMKEVGAAIGTAAVFSGAYRLPWKASKRTILLGAIMGITLKGLDWGKRELEGKVSQNSTNQSL